MDIKQQIVQKLEEVVKELTDQDIKIELSTPNDDSHGDYSSNVALRLSKVLGKNPLEIAEEITNDLGFKIKDLGIEKVEAIVPGFINFYLSQNSLITHAEEVLKTPEKIAGIRQIGNNRKAVVEYSSPNIAKPFTIGHLRSTIIGDAIANLLDAVGYEVYRDNHLGDWGTQFGKQIYAIKTWGKEDEIKKSENPVKDLVALYVKFHEEAEKNPELEEEGRKWFKKLEDGDPQARRLWQKCIDWSFKEFDRIYGELGVRFTENNGRGYGEAYFEDKMQPVIAELKEKGLLKEDKGAQLVFFPEDKLPPLMIIKQDGATLYATRDLATDKFRLEYYGKEVLVINEVGAEQSLYWRQIFEIEEMLGWYKKGQRIHIGHGLYRFKEGKMSTRKGNVIWLDNVLEEAQKRAISLVKHETIWEGSEVTSINKKEGKAARGQVLGVAEQLKVAEQVGIGALKWNDLKRSAHLDVAFDWDEILSMQGNSGPYVQYSYTRTHSILTKSGISNIQYPISNIQLTEDELRILRTIQKFPEVVEEAAITYSPNVITEYLFNLAQIFNNFYQKYRILQDPSQGQRVKGKEETALSSTHFVLSDDEQSFRLALTATVGVVIKQGLGLLGIAAPDKM